MSEFDTKMQRYSDNNRLSFPQYTGLAAKFQSRYGVSSFRAMSMVEETLAQRQAVLDEQAVKSGGMAYKPRPAPAPGLANLDGKPIPTLGGPGNLPQMKKREKVPAPKREVETADLNGLPIPTLGGPGNLPQFGR